MTNRGYAVAAVAMLASVLLLLVGTGLSGSWSDIGLWVGMVIGGGLGTWWMIKATRKGSKPK